LIQSFFLFLIFWFGSQNQYCEVYGRVYEVDDPMQAQFIVYEAGSETFADLVVYEQKNRLYVDKPGMWYFEEKRENARYRIYFTDKESEADFVVFFTRFESFAGCNQ
jgi:hypothetical protein